MSLEVRRAALLLLLPLAAACTSQWYPGIEHTERVRTDVVIRSDPSGAVITFNGKQQAPAPILIPVVYDHTETLYERQSNYGARMREDMSPVVEVLTFPIWLIPSFFHFTEQRRVHSYENNKHVVSAYLEGYDEAVQEITLEGQERFPVDVKLVKSK